MPQGRWDRLKSGTLDSVHYANISSACAIGLPHRSVKSDCTLHNVLLEFLCIKAQRHKNGGEE
jgi:hypothetical protein